MEGVLKEPFPEGMTFAEALKDGTRLCRLINEVQVCTMLLYVCVESARFKIGYAGLSTIILSSICIMHTLSISDSLGGLSPFLYSSITAGQRQENQPVHDDIQANGEHLPFSRRLPIARSPKL